MFFLIVLIVSSGLKLLNNVIIISQHISAVNDIFAFCAVLLFCYIKIFRFVDNFSLADLKIPPCLFLRTESFYYVVFLFFFVLLPIIDL